MTKNNVYVDLDEKCSGCGLCESICPVNAINIVQINGFFRPQISDKCINCGKCIKNCPGRIETELTTFRMFKHIYYGHSNNEALRNEAASGALTTELIKYMLGADIVDYVITSGVYRNDKNLGYVLIDKNNIEDLNKYSGSNYCPVNIGRAISRIKEIDGRYTVICLPCLARGIDKLRKTDKKLDSRIKYVITLLCNHVPSYEATDYLIERYNICSPRMIKYRGNGWFGCFRAYDSVENGTEFFSVPFSEYFGTKYSEYFWQKTCVRCMDHFGIYADACMGDADFVKYRGDQKNKGETIVFSNNSDIVDIIHKMKVLGILSVFSDIKNDELEKIYGPLSDMYRADVRNLRSGVALILQEERRNALLEKIGEKLCAVKRILFRIKELWS